MSALTGGTTLGIIPARKGSKRLPNKNITMLNGKPLIAWSIEAALAAKSLNEVVVSTDCEEIARIARKYGAKTPYLRPAHLSHDEAKTIDALFMPLILQTN